MSKDSKIEDKVELVPLSNDVVFDVSKAFGASPRCVSGFNFRQSNKGSYTDKTKYIPLYQSVLNMQQGKAVGSSSAVTLVTSKDYEFPDGKVPKDWEPTDGLLSMDLADITQMQRDLEERISRVEKELKSADEKQNLLLIRDSVKNKQKISDSLLSSIADKALSGILSKYNSTIQ